MTEGRYIAINIVIKVKRNSNIMNQREGMKMKKTTIEISEEQYFFLKEKALELQKQNKNASIISIIRELIERDMKEWQKTKAKR